MTRHGLDPRSQCIVEVARVVDARRHRHQLARAPELVDHGRWDAQPGRRPVDARGRRPGRTEALQERVHALAHRWIEPGLMVGQPDTSPFTDELVVGDQRIDQLAERGVVEGEVAAAAVRARPTVGSVCADLGDERVDANVGPQGLTTVQAARRRQQAPTSQAPHRLEARLGIRARHGRYGRPGIGDVPSTAILIACASSSERLCRLSPFSTGFAKTRV